MLFKNEGDLCLTFQRSALLNETQKEPVTRLQSLFLQQTAIDYQVFILEHVEDDLDIAVC